MLNIAFQPIASRTSCSVIAAAVAALLFVNAGNSFADQAAADLPLGLDADSMNVPEDNPITAEKIELGKLLYFDGRLSSDGTISCSSCHSPKDAFADPRPFSIGVNAGKGGRNAPTVLNSAFGYTQFWDGRSPSLEDQAKGPIINPVEMANTHDGAVANIAAVKGYIKHFEAAFGSPEVDIDRIAKAIATFERTVVSGNSKWDRFVYGGEKDALNESEQRGLALFEGKANCTRCHVGFNLSAGTFHNLGVGMSADKPDLGRYGVTKLEKDKGAFKTPTLRDISRTAPYMHDGSVKTLEEVIDLYVRGGEPNKWLDAKVVKLDLNAADKEDLLAFMLALDGDWKPFEAPTLPQ